MFGLTGYKFDIIHTVVLMHYISFKAVAAFVHLLIYCINSDPPVIWKTKFHTHVKQQVNHVNWMTMADGPEKATHFIVTNIVTCVATKILSIWSYCTSVNICLFLGP